MAEFIPEFTSDSIISKIDSAVERSAHLVLATCSDGGMIVFGPYSSRREAAACLAQICRRLGPGTEVLVMPITLPDGLLIDGAALCAATKSLVKRGRAVDLRHC